MRTRTKLRLCAGLVVAVLGVAWVLNLPPKPRVKASFVRYADDGAAVLSLTNLENYEVRCRVWHVALFSEQERRPASLVPSAFHLAAGSDTQLFAWPEEAPSLPASVSVQCYRSHPTNLRRRIGLLLLNSRTGIHMGMNTGTVATVTLPPRDTNAPAQPVTP